MRQRYNLHIPCEVFTLQVVSAPQRGLSVLERLALEAIHRGAYNLDLLQSIFRLGHRPVLDLVSDLWRQGHLRIDPYGNKFYVTENVEEVLKESFDGVPLPSAGEKESDGQELEGGQRSFRRIELVHDLLCHELLPEVYPDRLSSGVGEKRLIQPLLDLGSYQSLPAVSLEKAVIQRFNSLEEPEALRGERQRQQLIQFSVPGKRDNEMTGRLCFLRVQVEAVRGSTGRRRLQVVEPTFLSPIFRRRLSQRLTEILEEQRSDAAVLEEMLAKELDESPQPLRKLPDLVADVEQALEALDSESVMSDPEAASRHHRELRDLADDLVAELRHHEDREARIRWIRGQDALNQALLSSIGQAERQVVLSSPVIRWGRFRSFYDLLEKRLKDGLRVVVLWGTTRRSELEVEVRNALKSLSDVGNLQSSFRSMRTQASFLLRDANLGVFSGSAIFGDVPPGALTAVVRRSDDSEKEIREGEELYKEFPRVGAVVDELARVQRTALEMRIEEAVVLPQVAAGASVQLRRPPKLNPEIFAGDVVDVRVALSVWADCWKRWRRQIHDGLRRLGTSVSVVHDLQHLDWLAAAFKTDSPWLVLGGGVLSVRALDRARQHQLEALAQSGTRLLIVDGQRGEFDSEAAKTLASLCQRYPRNVRQIEIPFRGGVLATDKFLLVTSFELLGRPPLPTSDPAKRNLHTGILVQGGEPIREGLVLWLKDHPEELRFLDPEESRAPVDASPQQRWEDSLAHLDRVREDLIQILKHEESENHQVAYDEWLQSLPRSVSPVQAFHGVRSLVSANLTEHARRKALYLERRPLAVDAGPFHLTELATDLWRKNCLFEALRLFDALEASGHLSESTEVPPREFRLLLDAAGGEDFTSAVLEFLDYRPVDEALATASLCLSIQILITSETDMAIHKDAWELKQHVEMSAPDSWRQAVKPLLDFYSDTMIPVPWSILRDLRETYLGEKELAKRLQAVRESFEQAANTFFNFSLGALTWRRLFADDGMFGRLRYAVESGDREAGKHWLREWKENGKSAAEVMDKVALKVYQEVDYITESVITHRRRRNYVKRLETFIERLRDWIGSEPVDTGSLDANKVDALRRLSRYWPELCREVENAIPGGSGWEVPLCRGFSEFLALYNKPEEMRRCLWSRLWEEHGWRYPEIWVQGHGLILDPEQTVQAILRGLVHPPKNRSTVLDELLEQGHVDAALRLGRLTQREESEILDRAAAGLRQRRLHVLRELRVIDPSAEPQIKLPRSSGGDDSGRNLIECEAVLRRYETRLAAERRNRGLAAKPETKSIERLPKLSHWPYQDSVEVTLRRLRDRPQTFGGWTPTEPRAQRVIDLWASVLLDGEPPDRGWALDFATSLDGLLGVESADERVLCEGPYLITRLRSLPTSWPSPLREGEWQLWIPREPIDVPEVTETRELHLFFDPTFDPTKRLGDDAPEGALRIQPDLVFRTLIGDSTRARRYTWASEVGRQISLDLLLSCDTSSEEGMGFLVDLVGSAEPAQQVAAFLDLGGFRGWVASDAHEVVELTGGHTRWLRRYLEHLCTWLLDQGRDRKHLTSEVFEQVWSWGIFRASVFGDLDLLRERELAQAFLLTSIAYIWIDDIGGDGASRATLCEAVPKEMDVDAGLRDLETRGWIWQVGETGTIRPPSSAIGTLLIDYALDHGEDIEEQFARARRDSN